MLLRLPKEILPPEEYYQVMRRAVTNLLRFEYAHAAAARRSRREQGIPIAERNVQDRFLTVHCPYRECGERLLVPKVPLDPDDNFCVRSPSEPQN
jgi:hypothetical protein